jgi:subfamily B ATP-binding cassette protein MsbA
MILLLILHAVLTVCHSYLVASVGHKVVMDFRMKLFTHLTGLPIRFFNKRRTGELISRLTSDVGVMQNFSTDVPINLVKQIVTFIGGISILLYINWELCLMMLCILPFITLISALFGRRLKKLSKDLQDRTSEVSTALEEVVSGIRVVKSFLAESYEQSRFKRLIISMTATALNHSGLKAFFMPVISLITFTAAAGIIWYGTQKVNAGLMTPGDLIAFLLYGVVLIGPFGAFAHIFSQVRDVQGATQRVFEILDEKPDAPDLPNALALQSVQGRVTFQGVSFGYTPDREILQDISFEVEPGERIALVGPSGSGKSTIIQLLHRFYCPDKGWIKIDDCNIKQVKLDSLFKQIGFVPQETHLFGGTIRENILYGRLESAEEEIIAAAQAANAHDFIMDLPQAYDAEVGENGVLLSAGQRQRITIARTILKNPRILILDEATSSVDNESEIMIRDALEQLMARRTTFIIAHRLTTVHKCDRIFVIEQGKLVESGSHEELMRSKGLYHRLYTLADFDISG